MQDVDDTFTLHWQTSVKHSRKVYCIAIPGVITVDYWIEINGQKQVQNDEYKESLTELYRSVASEGRFHIYTCAGYSDVVEITYVEGKTLWLDTEFNRIYVFDAQEYSAQITSAYEEFVRLKENYPTYRMSDVW